MSAGFLIDTNVLSELRKGSRAHTPVQIWWQRMRDQELFLSVLSLGEIRKGIDRLRHRDAAQALVLERWSEEVRLHFDDRLIPVTAEIAEIWGRLQAVRPLPAIDGLIAATALWQNLTLVTRNEADFEGLGLRVINPFREDAM
jgi:toxin FitB